MGPNVKFVSAITDAFSNKKNGGQFFIKAPAETLNCLPKMASLNTGKLGYE